MTQFQLVWTHRPSGAGATARDYLDFVVDGESLRQRLGNLDLIGGMGWGVPEAERPYIQRLLSAAPADTPSGRVALYICPECGDLGCGGVTARVSLEGGQVVWSDFAHENDHSPESTRVIMGVGPFAFDAHEYKAALNARLEELA